jgi:membrane protein YqaA with SNARE-associated domain
VELIAVAVIGGIVLGLVMAWLIYVVVGRAVGTLIDWAIENFGNEAAAERVRRSREKERH